MSALIQQSIKKCPPYYSSHQKSVRLITAPGLSALLLSALVRFPFKRLLTFMNIIYIYIHLTLIRAPIVTNCTFERLFLFDGMINKKRTCSLDHPNMILVHFECDKHQILGQDDPTKIRAYPVSSVGCPSPCLACTPLLLSRRPRLRRRLHLSDGGRVRAPSRDDPGGPPCTDSM